MVADPRDIVDAIETIRKAVRFNRMDAISSIEKETIITLAAEKACQALTDLHGDKEFWSALRKSGIAKALEFVDLTIVDNELDRATINKISDFISALGMRKDESHEFVSNAISLINKAFEDNPEPERKTIDMAYSATDNLKNEVCASRKNKVGELSRMRNRRFLTKELYDRAKGGLTGSLFGYLSINSLSNRLPSQAKRVAESLTDVQRVKVFKLFYGSLLSEMTPPPPAIDIIAQG